MHKFLIFGALLLLGSPPAFCRTEQPLAMSEPIAAPVAGTNTTQNEPSDWAFTISTRTPQNEAISITMAEALAMVQPTIEVTANTWHLENGAAVNTVTVRDPYDTPGRLPDVLARIAAQTVRQHINAHAVKPDKNKVHYRELFTGIGLGVVLYTLLNCHKRSRDALSVPRDTAVNKVV